jgi:hypothetical protein
MASDVPRMFALNQRAARYKDPATVYVDAVDAAIDEPLADLIAWLNRVGCPTQWSCSGHLASHYDVPALKTAFTDAEFQAWVNGDHRAALYIDYDADACRYHEAIEAEVDGLRISPESSAYGRELSGFIVEPEQHPREYATVAAHDQAVLDAIDGLQRQFRSILEEMQDIQGSGT